MSDRLNLPDRWRRELEALLQKHVPDTEVWAYGSRVNGMGHEASDLDLVLRGPNLERIPTLQFSDLKEGLQESSIPILVDVHDWVRIPKSFHESIKQDYEAIPNHSLRTLGECATRFRDIVDPQCEPEARYIGLEHISEGTLSLLGNGRGCDVSSAKLRFQKGDILVGALRPYFRKVVQAPFDGLCSTDIWVLRSSEHVDQKYLFYTLAAPQFIEFLMARSIGTRMPRAKWEYAEEYPIDLPPLKEQRRIAAVLGSLDDRIELNRRMCETLESMAQALFKSWFVDFDPVGAKMEGRDTGLPDHIADLFPDRLVPSELGPIPEGWQVRDLGDFVEVVHGRSYRKSDLTPSEVALVTLKSFRRGGGYRADGLKAYAGVYDSRQVVRPGEVIVACTDVSQAGDVIGHSAVVQPSDCFSKLVASLDVAILRSATSDMSPEILLQIVKSPAFVSHTSGYATGTTVLHLDKSCLPHYRFVCPSSVLLDFFSAVSRVMMHEVLVLERRAAYLRQLRDVLLPHLVGNHRDSSVTEQGQRLALSVAHA